MNSLSQLKDIHAPPPIPWWPPAIGWWVVLLVIIVVAIYAFVKYKNRTIVVSYKQKNAMMDLESIKTKYQSDKNMQQTLDALSQMLKRLAIYRYPERGVAALHDEAWLQFLDETGQSHQFSTGVGVALTDLRYQAVGNHDVDMNALFGLVGKWVELNI